MTCPCDDGSRIPLRLPCAISGTALDRIERVATHGHGNPLPNLSQEPVNPRVNNGRNEGAELIEQIPS
jgi:hypothetical protein